MYRKILVLIENESFSDAVFKQSLALAKFSEANLMLLSVLSSQDQNAPVSPVSDSIYDISHTPLIQEYLQQLKAYEQAALDRLKLLAEQATNECVKTEFSLNRGDIGRMICDLAQTWQADLIVMAGREENSFLGLMLGSVGNYVTHHAPCSVLLVHQQNDSESPRLISPQENRV